MREQPPPTDGTPGTDDLEELAQAEPQRLVELSPDGKIHAPSLETRQLLQARIERAELLATGPDWAVLRNLNAVGAAAPGPRREVVCCGTMRESGLSLIDFIGFLATGDQTGVLTVSSSDAERSIYMHRGNVVWASSNSSEDRLGEFLVQRGKLTRDQLQTAIAKHGATRLGRACVECGFLAAHELWNLVQAQLTEIFDKILRTEEGLWSFARTSSEALAESQIHLSTQGLLVDALRRLDEMKVYREKIRSSDALVQKCPLSDSNIEARLASIKEVDLHFARAILHNSPRAVTIQEMMRLLGRGEFEVTRTTYHLLKAGLVEMLAPEAGTGPVPRRSDPNAAADVQEVLEVYSMALREMVEDVSQIGKEDVVLATARAFLNDNTLPQATVLRGIFLDSDGAIRLDGNLHSDGGVDGLNEGLSELLFFVLFQATDLLGHKRGDDLARRVKVILALLSSEKVGS